MSSEELFRDGLGVGKRCFARGCSEKFFFEKKGGEMEDQLDLTRQYMMSADQLSISNIEQILDKQIESPKL